MRCQRWEKATPSLPRDKAKNVVARLKEGLLTAYAPRLAYDCSVFLIISPLRMTRNITIIRCNHYYPGSARLYGQSVKLYAREAKRVR
jgi:hypothetical protein